MATVLEHYQFPLGKAGFAMLRPPAQLFRAASSDAPTSTGSSMFGSKKHDGVTKHMDETQLALKQPRTAPARGQLDQESGLVKDATEVATKQRVKIWHR